jgi:hypothetical protein
MSHLAMSILSFLSASANACITCWSAWPSWLIAPLGAVFVVESLMAGGFVPSCKRSKNNRSRLDLNAFDLCGIAAIGNTFICGGGSCLIVSQLTIVAWPVATFLCASAWKCSSASTNRAEMCGPHSTASHNSAFVHSFPVFAGHPYVAYSPWGTLNFDIVACWLFPPLVEFLPCALSSKYFVVVWLAVVFAFICSIFCVDPCRFL